MSKENRCGAGSTGKRSSRLATRSGSPATSPRGSTMPTATASSTGTSSPTTCSSTTGELVLAAAVREDDGEPSVRIGRALAGHLRFDGDRLDHGAGEGQAIGSRDGAGDDVGGGADL